MADSQAEKIRVLVVDDIPETRENLKKLLFFEKDIEVVSTAISGREAVEIVSHLHPAVVLMDINMPDMDGITATRTILDQAPGTQVIMMSVQGEMSYVRESMRAGAADFLIKPFTSDELVNSIRHVFAARPVVTSLTGLIPGMSAAAPVANQPEGKMIAVFSAKGGTGRSTLAANLACALRADDKTKVALWDTSFQFGDIGVMLNVQSQRTIVDLAGQVEELDADLVNGVMTNHSSGIKVLLAPTQPEQAESITNETVDNIKEWLVRLYDYVVVDTPTSLGDQALAVLDAAHRIVLLVTPEIPAIKNTRLFLDIAERLDYGHKIVLALNKWDRRTGIRPEKLESAFNHRIDALIPLDERTVLLSVNQGLPFVMSYKTAPISQSVFDLAKHLVEDMQPEPVQQSAADASDGKQQPPASRLGRRLR